MTTDDLDGRVYDSLADAPHGLNIHELADMHDVSVDRVRKSLHRLRLMLAENDTLFVLADPDGPRRPWRYHLVDGSQIVSSEATGWTTNRIGDAESRLTMIQASMEVAVRATDGRSRLGRKARVIRKQVTRLVEDLEEINSELAPV